MLPADPEPAWEVKAHEIGISLEKAYDNFFYLLHLARMDRYTFESCALRHGWWHLVSARDLSAALAHTAPSLEWSELVTRMTAALDRAMAQLSRARSVVPEPKALTDPSDEVDKRIELMLRQYLLRVDRQVKLALTDYWKLLRAIQGGGPRAVN